MWHIPVFRRCDIPPPPSPVVELLEWASTSLSASTVGPLTLPLTETTDRSVDGATGGVLVQMPIGLVLKIPPRHHHHRHMTNNPLKILARPGGSTFRGSAVVYQDMTTR